MKNGLQVKFGSYWQRQQLMKKSVAAMHYRTAFTTFPEYEVTLAAALQRHQYRENTAAHSCSKSS